VSVIILKNFLTCSH